MRLAHRIYQILFCLIGLVNFGLVLFDATYLWKLPYTRMTARDVYLKHFPEIVKKYDPVKGIEPHRFTTKYLASADQAFDLAAAGNAKEAEKVFAELIEMSREVIDQRPGFSHFSIAEKDGTLQVIKNNIRERYGIESAKDSFARFWSKDNLTPDRVQAEREFFNKQIRPFMEQNYFRWIDEDGEMRDYFYRIDIWFVAFFWIDFLSRWGFAIVRKKHRKWYLFPVRHATEIVNLIPPHHAVWMRLLRVVPLYFRMKKAGLLPGEGILPEIIHDNAALIAEEISGLVLVNILDQVSVIVRNADTSGLLEKDGARMTQEMLNSQLDRIADRVIPDIEPQITTLVIHSVYQAMGTYLRTPLAPVLKLVLVAVETAIKDGLRAALSNDEGREQMKEILRAFMAEGVREVASPDNLKLMQEQSAVLLESLREEIRRSMT